MRLFVFTFLLAAPLAAFAQSRPAKAPVVLQAGHIAPDYSGNSNRPDKAPEYPGGPEAMGEFFAQNVHVPAKAQHDRVTGNVVVTATVGVDGKLTSPKIAQGLTPECNAEALRVVQTLPAWQPASRRGVPMPMLVQVPVPFNNAGVTEFEQDHRVPHSAKDAPGL